MEICIGLKLVVLNPAAQLNNSSGNLVEMRGATLFLWQSKSLFVSFLKRICCILMKYLDMMRTSIGEIRDTGRYYEFHR